MDDRLALKADIIARQFGGRVIMCDTHNPPQQLEVTQIGDEGGGGGGDSFAVLDADTDAGTDAGDGAVAGQDDVGNEPPIFMDERNATWLR